MGEGAITEAKKLVAEGWPCIRFGGQGIYRSENPNDETTGTTAGNDPLLFEPREVRTVSPGLKLSPWCLLNSGGLYYFTVDCKNDRVDTQGPSCSGQRSRDRYRVRRMYSPVRCLSLQFNGCSRPDSIALTDYARAKPTQVSSPPLRCRGGQLRAEATTRWAR